MDYQDQVIPLTDSKFLQWFRFDQFQPERAVTSYFVSTKTLLYIRVIQFLYSGAVQWASVYWMATQFEFKHYFAYFTYLTFIGLHAYFMVTLYHHIQYIRSDQRPVSLLYQYPILNYLYVYLYHTVVTFNLVTPTVYWALLSYDFLSKAGTNPPMELWLTPSVHGVSFLMVLIDVILNRMVMHGRICLLVLLNVLIYLCLAFIYFAVDHWWVYSFMDWNKPVTAISYYIALTIFIAICFFIQMGIHSLRDFIARKTSTSKRESDTSYDLEIADDDLKNPFESGIASQITFSAKSTDHLAI
ncbi:unnamed protein product [Cunninghamella blakesleeana]